MHRSGPFAALFDAFLPVTCAVCGLPGRPLCARCLASLGAGVVRGCRTCGHPLPSSPERCAACPRGLLLTRHAVPFDACSGRVVSHLKDRGRRDLAAAIARVIVARCDPPPAGSVLIPVPLTDSRYAARGYNQSADIADALARRWRVDVVADALVRARDAPPQRGASRTARAVQVRGAFVASAPSVPERVWLVDDVHTTGATLTACALALRRAGTDAVSALTFARVTA